MTANLSAYEARRKSTGVAYLWWFFLGLFGAHRLYAARDASGWWLMALHVGGWALLAAAFFWGADRSTQTYETAFGVASMTSITATAKGSALFWTGNGAARGRHGCVADRHIPRAGAGAPLEQRRGGGAGAGRAALILLAYTTSMT